MSIMRSMTSRLRKQNGDGGVRKALRQLQPVESMKNLEEETAGDYQRREFYPVLIGMTLQSRYEVLAKLGWGSGSTVWFCKDQLTKRYVAVKVCTVQLAADGSRHVQQRLEWKAYSRLSGMETTHEGVRFIREILERFDLMGPSGAEHPCFVFDVAGLHLQDLERIYPGSRLPINLTKDVLKNILKAMDFLHTEAGIVHTDIKKDNIFFPASQRCCALFAERLARQKPAGKHDGQSNNIVYKSVKFTDLLSSQEMSLGRPVLGDFSEAQIIKDGRYGLPPRLVGPEPFRSPESIVGMPLNTGLDLWAFSQMAFSMMSHRLLLTVYDSDGDWSPTMQLAQMQALMGPPPRVILVQSRYALNYWNDDGSWKHSNRRGPSDFDNELDTALETADSAAHGYLIEFLRCIFKWLPEERATASKLLHHRFLDAAYVDDVPFEQPAAAPAVQEHRYQHQPQTRPQHNRQQSFQQDPEKLDRNVDRRPQTASAAGKPSMDVACQELKQMKRKQSVLRRAFMG
ncbi:hypothetical protein LTR78_009119 [Recurvomyces mirabilis]|uniref:non-specific serine/threonine protein kinase n=1 Tax=Recurvomyces mirabilis TaxID=574656 RepID=A0AAE0WHI0_9PEZI|nr:hypothetical protein LTR78_009119 [Recurvomyces mirabilis]KAK5161057.1 hypothetical protein LTS14_000852 [Recurvomyces mirabilis]